MGLRTETWTNYNSSETVRYSTGLIQPDDPYLAQTRFVLQGVCFRWSKSVLSPSTKQDTAGISHSAAHLQKGGVVIGEVSDGSLFSQANHGVYGGTRGEAIRHQLRRVYGEGQGCKKRILFFDIYSDPVDGEHT